MHGPISASFAEIINFKGYVTSAVQSFIFRFQQQRMIRFWLLHARMEPTLHLAVSHLHAHFLSSSLFSNLHFCVKIDICFMWFRHLM
jgi:hypothetical protein